MSRVRDTIEMLFVDGPMSVEHPATPEYRYFRAKCNRKRCYAPVERSKVERSQETSKSQTSSAQSADRIERIIERPAQGANAHDGAGHKEIEPAVFGNGATALLSQIRAVPDNAALVTTANPLAKDADFDRSTVIGAGPIEPRQQNIAATHSLPVNGVDLLRRSWLGASEDFVGNKALNTVRTKLRRHGIKSATFRCGKQWSREIYPHIAPSMLSG